MAKFYEIVIFTAAL
jgi:CTD small phosphatase-like protein 2